MGVQVPPEAPTSFLPSNIDDLENFDEQESEEYNPLEWAKYMAQANIADPGYLPLKNAVKIVTPNAYPLPIFPLERINKLLNKAIAGVPNYLVDYLKYPCLVSNKKFIKLMGEDFFKFSTETALESLLIRNLPYLAATESSS